jgi:hypothetical protein
MTSRNSLIVIIALCAALAGCSEEEDLGNCKRQVEQTVLLRQLALPPQKKAEVESCLTNNFPPEFCRAVYLNEDNIIRDCMSDKGYSFAPIHSLRDHVNAKCYRPTWLVKLDDRFHEPDHGTGDLLVDSSFAVR